jgi:LacI family transcriptional regulator
MTELGVPKYQRVADAIEAQVRKGRWEGGRMPSVRGIADQYEVSIVTASRALQVLRDKGLIQTVERSGTFRLPPATAERWAVVLRVTPGPYRAATAEVTRSGFEAVARKQPMHLHFDAFTLEAGLTPDAAERAARQAKATGLRGVFLLPSRASADDARVDEAFLAGCRRAGLPVVLIERGLRGRLGKPDADLVTLDDADAAADCTRHLFDLGRKRVAMAVASPTSTHNDRVAGYLFAVHAARAAGKKPEPPELVIRLPEEKPGEGVSAYLADRVMKEKIDGVICYQDYVAMGLIVELLARRVKVPGDVAVVGFDDIDIGGLFPAGLTTYKYPAEGMAEQAVRLMRERLEDPDRPAVRVVVPGRLIVRGSSQSK